MGRLNPATPVSLVLCFLFLLTQVGRVCNSPSGPLGFVSELDDNTYIDDCEDATNCEPFGHDFCMGSPNDTLWSAACCRKFCRFCDDPIPPNQRCDHPPLILNES